MRTPGAREIQPDDVNAATRRALALKMRGEGCSQREIAEAIGVSQSMVSKMVRRGLAEHRQDEGTQLLRGVEAERLERLHRTFAPRSDRGSTGAARIVIQASERRSKLLGLDTPVAPAEGSGGGGITTTMVLVGLEEGLTPEREAEAIEAAVTAAGAKGAPRLQVRVYPLYALEAV